MFCAVKMSNEGVKEVSSIVHEISDILDNICRPCEKRQELNITYASCYSKIDGYCNSHCPVGKQLQGLGKRMGRWGNRK